MKDILKVQGHIIVKELSSDEAFHVNALLRHGGNHATRQIQKLLASVKPSYEVDNLVTTYGMKLLCKQLAWAGRKNKNPFEMTHIWTTSNSSTVLAGDTTAEFCTFGTDAIATPSIVRYYPTGIDVVYLARLGPPEGNFRIRKVGIVTKNKILVAQANTDYTKTIGTTIFVEYHIIIGGS